MAVERDLDDAAYARLGTAGGAPQSSSRGIRGRLLAGLGIIAFMLVVAGGAFWLGWEKHGGSPAGLEPPPLIKAEEKPIKISPESPGGQEVPNRDKLVYKRLQGSGEKVGMERLMPEAERPLPPPSAGEPAVSTTGEPGAATPAEPASPTPSMKSATPPNTAGQPAAQTAAVKVPPAVAAPAKSTDKPVEKAKLTTPPKSAYQIQLLAARSQEEAEAAWSKLQSKNGDVLKGVAAGVARADLGDKGTFYRLRAGPFESEQKARATCAALTSRGASCVVIKLAGN